MPDSPEPLPLGSHPEISLAIVKELDTPPSSGLADYRERPLTGDSEALIEIAYPHGPGSVLAEPLPDVARLGNDVNLLETVTPRLFAENGAQRRHPHTSLTVLVNCRHRAFTKTIL